MTNVTRTDPVVTVNAWVPLTPVQLRADLLEDPDLSVIQSEDEVWEAEILFTRGDFRTFVKAQAVCEQASIVIAVVGPESAADSVPVPAGSGR